MTSRPQQVTRRSSVLRREAVVAAIPAAVAALLVAAGPAAAGPVGTSGAGTRTSRSRATAVTTSDTTA